MALYDIRSEVNIFSSSELYSRYPHFRTPQVFALPIFCDNQTTYLHRTLVKGSSHKIMMFQIVIWRETKQYQVVFFWEDVTLAASSQYRTLNCLMRCLAH